MNSDDITNPHRDAEREQALAELAEMNGEVSKPRFTGNPWDFAPSYD